MSDELHNFLKAARAMRADMDRLGVSKPQVDDERTQKWIDENWDSTGAASTQPQPGVPDNVRDIIRLWRNRTNDRAQAKLGTNADFVAAMLLDEVAQIDAWLTQEGKAQP